MSADQSAPYRPAPVTQRDGSPLANSNCRMASIATGIDYETRGEDTSTGSRMRSYTDDQSGGTDSGDARQAWDRGYEAALTVRDGSTFDVALGDLRAGRLVHLDVWHATVGGPCMSGSGAYGHTMAVLPDCLAGAWLVSDPWCNPPKWARVDERKLRAGAEEWGRRVYHEATGGRGRGDPIPVLLLIAAAKLLMSRAYPGHESHEPSPRATGGPVACLFTATHPLEVETVGIRANIRQAVTGTATIRGEGHSAIQLADGDAIPVPAGQVRQVYARGELAEPWDAGHTTFPAGTPVVFIGTEAALLFEADCELALTPAGGDPESIVAVRDAEWVDALTEFWPVGVELSLARPGGDGA